MFVDLDVLKRLTHFAQNLKFLLVLPIMKKYHLLKRFSTNFHIFLFLKTVNQTHSYYLPTCFMSSYGVVFFLNCVVCD